MKTTTRCTYALAAVIVLMLQSNSVLAKFGGNLRSDLPWTLDISPETSSAFTATISFVDSRGRQDLDIFTIQAGEAFMPYSNVNIPRGTRRIIIDLDSLSTAFQVRVVQSTNVILVDVCCESSRVVFDVV